MRRTATLQLSVMAASWLAALGGGVSQDLLRESLRDRGIGDEWIYDDWSEARERSAATGKPIFAVFRCVP